MEAVENAVPPASVPAAHVRLVYGSHQSFRLQAPLVRCLGRIWHRTDLRSRRGVFCNLYILKRTSIVTFFLRRHRLCGRLDP